jgi:hypothetical protein
VFLWLTIPKGEILYLAGQGRNKDTGKSETVSNVLFSAFVAHD